MNNRSFELEIPSVIVHSEHPSSILSVTTEETSNAEHSERKYIVILTMLFFLQGLPGGFLSGISMMMMSYGATTQQLAILGIACTPYSMKIFIAPIIDVFYSDRLGKRRSYILPCYYIIGLVMVIMGLSQFQNLVKSLNIISIMLISLVIHGAMSVSEIAIDGWLLSSLSKQTVHFASTCSCIGSNLGSLVGSVVMINLTSIQFRDQFFSVHATTPLLSIDDFAYISGFLILLLTVGIHQFSSETPQRKVEDYGKNFCEMYYNVILDLGRLYHNKNMRVLMFYLLLRSFPFAPISSTSCLKLIQIGNFPTEILTQLKVFLFPFKAFTACMVGKYLKRGQESQWIYLGFWFRFFESVAFYFLVANITELGGFNSNTLWMIIILSVLADTVGTFLGVSSSGFFMRISDANVGGSYLTLLASADNLGGLISGSMALILSDFIPYTPLVITFWVLGLIFIVVMKNPLLDLQKAELSSWSCRAAE